MTTLGVWLVGLLVAGLVLVCAVVWGCCAAASLASREEEERWRTR